MNFSFFQNLYKTVLGPCHGALPKLSEASETSLWAGWGAGLGADRAPGCGAPGCCSLRSGTAVPCDEAASRSPAPAACSSAARVPTSPLSASAGPVQAQGREVTTATMKATEPRRPWGPAQGGPWARRDCAHAEADACGAKSHERARVTKVGLRPAGPHRPLAITP